MSVTNMHGRPIGQPEWVKPHNFAKPQQSQLEETSLVNRQDRWAGKGDAPEGDMSFWDFLDIINPLQHIPIIGDVYRAVTGDEISPAARIAGGALYGGPIGAAAAVANTVLEETTGDDLGGHIQTALSGEETPDLPTETAPTQLAQAQASAPTASVTETSQPEAAAEITQSAELAELRLEAGRSSLMFAGAPSMPAVSIGAQQAQADLQAAQMLAQNRLQQAAQNPLDTAEEEILNNVAPAAGTVPNQTQARAHFSQMMETGLDKYYTQN